MKTHLIRITLTLTTLFILTLLVKANFSEPNLISEFELNKMEDVFLDVEYLSIEDWMTDDEEWSTPAENNLIEEEEIIEVELQIEDWMLSDEYFKFNQFKIEDDKKLSIEKCMTDKKHWKL